MSIPRPFSFLILQNREVGDMHLLPRLSVWRIFLVFSSSQLCLEGYERSRSADAILTVPVTVDGNVEDLRLFEGESYEDAATAFARTNGLMNLKDPNKVQQIVQQLSGILKDRSMAMQSAEPTPSETESERTVQLTIPLTIDGSSTQLVKYKEENSQDAVNRFFSTLTLTEDVKAQLVPQLLSLIQTRLEEIQVRKEELFSFTVTIDGKDTVVRHYQDGNPEEEAMDVLRALNMDLITMQHLAPQIKAEITKRLGMGGLSEAQSHENVISDSHRELFTVQVTINGIAADLAHNEGDTLEETASSFLHKHGIIDEESVQTYMPQLIDILRARLDALQVKQEESSPVEPTSHDPKSLVEEQAFPEPFVIINVQVEDGHEALLRYYEGDDINLTVKHFLESFKLADDEIYQQNFHHLVTLLQDRVKTRLEELSEADNSRHPTVFTVPVSLGGVEHNFEYYEGQEPLHAIRTFCDERLQTFRADNSIEFDNAQMQECKNMLVSHMKNILEQPRAREEQDAAGHAEDTTQLDKAELLFTIEIDIGDSRIAHLKYHRGQNPTSVAEAFCEEFKIDVKNVPMLVEALEGQLTKL